MHQLSSLPRLGRHIADTMPWVTLLTGCLGGTALLAVLARLTGTSHPMLDQGTVRLTFLPAVAALAFVPRTPIRPLAQTLPVPAWVSAAGHLVLAVPVLAVTCWAQLLIAAHTTPPRAMGHPPAVYPVIAQLPPGARSPWPPPRAWTDPATPTSAAPSPVRPASRPSHWPGTPPSPARS
jgi:hypothetical protein